MIDTIYNFKSDCYKTVSYLLLLNLNYDKLMFKFVFIIHSSELVLLGSLLAND